MKRSRMGALFAALSLALVCALALFAVRRTSPGPLSPTHARLAELADPDGCAQCHGGLFESMQQACSECHAGIGQDIAAGAGLHGTLPASAQAERCADCHLEHAGARKPLTSAASYARAGIPDPRAYDHATLDFRLGGRHAELGCVDCHANAELELLPVGAARFRGLDQSCSACHADVHAGSMARACADCHGQAHPFQQVETFRHARFATRGAHDRAQCTSCHPADSPHAVEVLAGAGPYPAERACADCHASPHAQGFLAGAGAERAVAAGASCATCHDAVHGDWRDTGTTPALHAASGFPLGEPHAALACERCHADAPDAPFAVRFPGRLADDCAACHDDPHAGQFDHAPFQERGCLSCHARESFHPFAFDVRAHERTAFPLQGSHAAVACSACHRAPADDGPAARRFAGTSAACADCHADAHDGRLVAAPGSAPECGQCHVPERFATVDRAAFDHRSQTSFVLDGAHAALACETCHPRAARADEHQRRFGFVHQAFGEPVGACATCHADAHRGAFDAALASSAPLEAGCERCHGTATFALAEPASFDHRRWTGLPLEGAHAALACESCHVPRSAPDATGRRFGSAAGRRCEDCHADPHVGQFAAQGQSCAQCHRDDLTLSFDHQRDSRYPLDATHRALDCAACHRPWPLPDGGSALRYKPLGTTCAECHGPGGRR